VSEAARLPKFLSAKDVATATGLQVWQLYRMVRLAEDRRAGGARARRAEEKMKKRERPLPPPPPFLWMGRKLWFPEDGFLAWIEERTNGKQ
jgi:hypothetical protein